MHAAMVEVLRQSGHDVLYAAEVLQQDPDHALLEHAFAERRLLLTEDKDFGELVFREGRRAAGVILLRIHGRHWTTKWGRLQQVIAAHGEALHGRFTVVGPSGIRMQLLQRG
jgi:predicted nuclease of predicted toxin-antitoxin system